MTLIPSLPAPAFAQPVQEAVLLLKSSAVIEVVHQNTGDVVAGGLNRDCSNIMGHHWHAVDYAGVLILADRVRPGLPHLQQTAGPIPAHPRHDDTNHAAADRGGH